MSKLNPTGWLMGIFVRLATDHEIPFNKLTNEQIALAVESNHNTLSAIFQVNGNDEYEHYTQLLTVPQDKRGQIAEAAITEPFREISPVLPNDDDRLFLYGNRKELENKNEEQIREYILDDMGRLAGYDNEKYPVFQSVLFQQ